MNLEKMAEELGLPKATEEMLRQNYDLYFASADAGLPYAGLFATEERRYFRN